MALQPVTEIATRFNADCKKLLDSLRETESSLPGAEMEEKASEAIQHFFDTMQKLPNELATMETRGTALFEIDCALQGLYGNPVFSGITDDTPIRLLLKDLAALWQRYYLYAFVERYSDGQSIPGTMNFYESWMSSEDEPDQLPEYDRLLRDVSLMMRITEGLNVPVKVMLFSLMGKILVALGVSDEFARGRLKESEMVFRRREEETSTDEFSDVLLCMQVLASKEKRPEDTGLERILVKKALAFWASRDDFLDKLFRSWGWFWGYDFVSHLAMGDSLKLREQSLLHQSWLNGSGNLNIGHSYVEWEQHRKNNPTLTNVFKPIPFFVFGSSGVGKSALLNAFCYHAQMRKGRSLTLGRELQAYHDRSSGEWRAGHMAPTSGYKSFNFWEDLNVTSFTVFDYGGKDTQPDQWEAQLQENIRSSRGLLFLVSAEDIGDSAALRGKSSWFEAILQYWMQCNPGMRHIPVGLVLTKADLVLRDQLPSLKRPYLVPDDIQRGLVEMYFPHRFIGQGEDLQTRAGRLQSAITSNKSNNLNPALQDLIFALLGDFTQFFNRVVDLTYNYQIFLTSALPPQAENDSLFPWGVDEPYAWTAKALEKFYLKESLVKLQEDQQQIESESKIIREDINDLQRLMQTIDHHSSEISRLRQKPSLFQVTMRDRIKFHEEERKKANDEFIAKVQAYESTFADPNRHKGLQVVDRQMKDKEKTLAEIKQKRREYEKRLQENGTGGARPQGAAS